MLKEKHQLRPPKLCAITVAIMQVLTPAAIGFAPQFSARASMPSRKSTYIHSDVADQNIKSNHTVIHILKPGETTHSIASQYGITLSQLKKLNQFRIFTHGFEHLQPGDEIDVPAAITPDTQKQNNEMVPLNAGDGISEEHVASAALQFGNFLSDDPDGDAAVSMAKGITVGKANQTVQSWLNQFGTAQVQLSVDDKFSLKDSSVNLLHPWYDTPDNIVFTQTGIHRADDRTQTNLGIGFRHLRDADLFGVNAFYDYDLSREHARAGFGAEYWRNYFKVSANSYIHLSDWKNSPDVKGYDERPADGWDIRTEGFLPAMPQLGAKVVYEQYYGDQVALFGKDKLQKNPHAITAGVSYTPFPLLTLSADQKMGQQGENETTFKADLNYRLGVPLGIQLDTSAVALARSLQGSRYDLIDRNNNIILEYRKQDVIRLSMPARIQGNAQQTIPITLSVRAKNGLKDVQWDDADLIAAGGKLKGQGTNWQLTLPSWKAGTVNAWSVSAVAHDNKDNSSKRAEMQVVLKAPQVSAENSTLTVATDRLLADGKSNTVVTVSLKDIDGNPMPGMADQIHLTGTLNKDANLLGGGTPVKAGINQKAGLPKLSGLKETQPGIYTATLTAGYDSGTYTVSSTTQGIDLVQKKDVLIEDTAADFSLMQSTLTTDKTDLVDDGIDKATLTLTLMNKAADGSLHKVSGEAERLQLYIADKNIDLSKFTLSKFQEQSSIPGVYQATLTGKIPENNMPVGLKINGKVAPRKVNLTLGNSLGVTVSGDPIVGETLTANVTNASTSTSHLKYQWQVEKNINSDVFVNITGATNKTYTPAKDDQKKRIRVEVDE